MARASANFLQCAYSLARMSGLGPDPAQADLGLSAEDLRDVLLDWQQGYDDAYNWNNQNWEDAWTSDTLTPDDDGLITYAQLQDAAQFTVWSEDPRTSKCARALNFRSSDAGIHIPDWTGDVFVFFKPVCPTFTFEEWNSGTTYAAGDTRLATNGQNYIALQASTNQSPLTQTAYWREVPVLQVLTRPVQLMALANKATRDGKHGEARKMQSDADDKLDDQAQLEFPRVSSWWWIQRQN